MRIGRGIAGLALGACAAAVIACGAARPQTAVAQPSANHPADDPRAEIARLDHQIADERTQLGLAEPMATPTAPCDGPGCAQSTPMSAHGVAPEVTCERNPAAVCTNVCTISDSICESADRICALADELHGDAEAAATCVRGHASCHAAQARCCGCPGANDPPG